MILKEQEPRPDADRRSQAGAAAERQMAFYLRRAFGDEPAVAVVNDLRVPTPGQAGDFAQVDHLLVHRFGLIVVESKSVHGTVAVNAQGEWTQTYQGRPQGMASPVAQARRQADAVRRVLAARFDPLGSGLFGRVPIDVLVAVSDGGIIDRGSADVPEVCKADAVTGRVRTWLTARSAEGKRFDGPARQKVAAYLMSLHVPGRTGVSRPAPPGVAAVTRPASPADPPTSPELPLAACRSCGSRLLHAQHGRYGYDFRCLACTANTPIPKGCPACKSPDARVRKDKLNFYKDCPACGRTGLFYVNASPADPSGPDDER